MSQTDIDQMIGQAEFLINSGQFHDAKEMFFSICREDPNRADAWLMLGAVSGELGQVTEAITYIQAAIRLQPENPDAHVSLASILCATGQLSEARDHCLRATQILPDHEHAWLVLSGIYGQLGNPDEAEVCARRTLEVWPDCIPAFINLGNAMIAQGRLDEAAQSFARVLEMDPQCFDAWLSLANLKVRMGDIAGAEACYLAVIGHESGSRQALDGMGHVSNALGKYHEALGWFQKSLVSNPGVTDTWINMGDVYHVMGDLQNSIECYRQALKINPDLAEIHSRIGHMYGKSGNLKEAKIAFERSLLLDPKLATSYLKLADISRMEGEYDKACLNYKRAIEADPSIVGAHDSLGDLLQDQGKIDEACEYYRRALLLTGSDAIKIKLATTYPIILASRDHITDARKTLTEAIDDLLRSPRLFVEDPASEINRTVFFPVYGGLDDLDIQVKISSLYEKAAPALLYSAAHCQKRNHMIPGAKVRLGLISRHFFSHTIGHVMMGLVEHFSRDKFEVTVFTFPYESDPVANRINNHAARVVLLPKEWRDAHAIVAREEMDILFYADIGMDAYTYFLAHARLAPVQCTTWGHAVTTGLRNMDYYITCADFEPEGADNHYSEKLVRVSAPPAYYYRPVLPATTKSRADYALDADMNFYLCPQTLYKFHPDFDEMIAGILRGDKNGQVVIFSGKEQHWLDLLFSRFNISMPDVVDRLRVLQYPGISEYLNLLHDCDVMLDTYHYGGGSSSLQGLAFGTPIVTLPGNYQRGRHTYAYYKQMDFMECVATDSANYVEIAIRLGTNRSYRRRVSEEILARNDVLYKNMSVVREMEQFFIEAAGNLPLSG